MLSISSERTAVLLLLLLSSVFVTVDTAAALNATTMTKEATKSGSRTPTITASESLSSATTATALISPTNEVNPPPAANNNTTCDELKITDWNPAGIGTTGCRLFVDVVTNGGQVAYVTTASGGVLTRDTDRACNISEVGLDNIKRPFAGNDCGDLVDVPLASAKFSEFIWFITTYDRNVFYVQDNGKLKKMDLSADRVTHVAGTGASANEDPQAILNTLGPALTAIIGNAYLATVSSTGVVYFAVDLGVANVRMILRYNPMSETVGLAVPYSNTKAPLVGGEMPSTGSYGNVLALLPVPSSLGGAEDLLIHSRCNDANCTKEFGVFVYHSVSKQLIVRSLDGMLPAIPGNFGRIGITKNATSVLYTVNTSRSPIDAQHMLLKYDVVNNVFGLTTGIGNREDGVPPFTPMWANEIKVELLYGMVYTADDRKLWMAHRHDSTYTVLRVEWRPFPVPTRTESFTLPPNISNIQIQCSDMLNDATATRFNISNETSHVLIEDCVGNLTGSVTLFVLPRDGSTPLKILISNVSLTNGSFTVQNSDSESPLRNVQLLMLNSTFHAMADAAAMINNGPNEATDLVIRGENAFIECSAAALSVVAQFSRVSNVVIELRDSTVQYNDSDEHITNPLRDSSLVGSVFATGIGGSDGASFSVHSCALTAGSSLRLRFAAVGSFVLSSDHPETAIAISKLNFTMTGFRNRLSAELCMYCNDENAVSLLGMVAWSDRMEQLVFTDTVSIAVHWGKSESYTVGSRISAVAGVAILSEYLATVRFSSPVDVSVSAPFDLQGSCSAVTYITMPHAVTTIGGIVIGIGTPRSQAATVEFDAGASFAMTGAPTWLRTSVFTEFGHAAVFGLAVAMGRYRQGALELNVTAPNVKVLSNISYSGSSDLVRFVYADSSGALFGVACTAWGSSLKMNIDVSNLVVDGSVFRDPADPSETREVQRHTNVELRQRSVFATYGIAVAAFDFAGVEGRVFVDATSMQVTARDSVGADVRSGLLNGDNAVAFGGIALMCLDAYHSDVALWGQHATFTKGADTVFSSSLPAQNTSAIGALGIAVLSRNAGPHPSAPTLLLDGLHIEAEQGEVQLTLGSRNTSSSAIAAMGVAVQCESPAAPWVMLEGAKLACQGNAVCNVQLHAGDRVAAAALGATVLAVSKATTGYARLNTNAINIHGAPHTNLSLATGMDPAPGTSVALLSVVLVITNSNGMSGLSIVDGLIVAENGALATTSPSFDGWGGALTVIADVRFDNSSSIASVMCEGVNVFHGSSRISTPACPLLNATNRTQTFSPSQSRTSSLVIPAQRPPTPTMTLPPHIAPVPSPLAIAGGSVRTVPADVVFDVDVRRDGRPLRSRCLEGEWSATPKVWGRMNSMMFETLLGYLNTSSPVVRLPGCQQCAETVLQVSFSCVSIDEGIMTASQTLRFVSNTSLAVSISGADRVVPTDSPLSLFLTIEGPIDEAMPPMIQWFVNGMKFGDAATTMRSLTVPGFRVKPGTVVAVQVGGDSGGGSEAEVTLRVLKAIKGSCSVSFVSGMEPNATLPTSLVSQVAVEAKLGEGNADDEMEYFFAWSDPVSGHRVPLSGSFNSTNRVEFLAPYLGPGERVVNLHATVQHRGLPATAVPLGCSFTVLSPAQQPSSNTVYFTADAMMIPVHSDMRNRTFANIAPATGAVMAYFLATMNTADEMMKHWRATMVKDLIAGLQAAVDSNTTANGTTTPLLARTGYVEAVLSSLNLVASDSESMRNGTLPSIELSTEVLHCLLTIVDSATTEIVLATGDTVVVPPLSEAAVDAAMAIMSKLGTHSNASIQVMVALTKALGRGGAIGDTTVVSEENVDVATAVRPLGAFHGFTLQARAASISFPASGLPLRQVSSMTTVAMSAAVMLRVSDAVAVPPHLLLASAMVEVSATVAGQTFEVSNVSSGINITVPILPSDSGNEDFGDDVICMFLDVDGIWSTDGVTTLSVDIEKRVAVCLTTHFSLFAAFRIRRTSAPPTTVQTDMPVPTTSTTTFPNTTTDFVTSTGPNTTEQNTTSPPTDAPSNTSSWTPEPASVAPNSTGMPTNGSIVPDPAPMEEDDKTLLIVVIVLTIVAALAVIVGGGWCGWRYYHKNRGVSPKGIIATDEAAEAELSEELTRLYRAAPGAYLGGRNFNARELDVLRDKETAIDVQDEQQPIMKVRNPMDDPNFATAILRAPIAEFENGSIRSMEEIGRLLPKPGDGFFPTASPLGSNRAFRSMAGQFDDVSDFVARGQTRETDEPKGNGKPSQMYDFL